MSKITTNVYKLSKNNRTPFDVQPLWAVDHPTIEFDSKKHGSLSITFNDGFIDILYWSPKITDKMTNVRASHIILKP